MEELIGVNFKRGFLQLIILSLLTHEDMYGLQIIEETDKRSHGLFQTQIGSLYPVLYKLLESHCISSKTVPSSRYMHRVYYHIEKEGLEYLEVLKQQFYDITNGIKFLIEEDV